MERFICIHGHFYQPPRENPWLETIELQDSAYPFHDWNERITAECYAPNAAARILDGEGRIGNIVNNYSRISFNMGPTLLAWMESAEPTIYQAILEADRQSQERFSGHGSAIAQAYNHMILPLANRRDKYSQVRWGIDDFQHRFGRMPEGMWLAETAVDLETLDIMAELGIKYTVLSPYQAGRVRPLDNPDGEWQDVVGGRIDPTTVYLQRLPSGRSIHLFFYDGPISRGIAFEGLLKRGEDFAGRLLGAFNGDRPWPQLVHIATDGETYGHHHGHGDMALAYALHHIEANNLARLTNYGEYLALHEATLEVEIVENTAWSCAHGVDRWRVNCGCNGGGYPGWTQEWRAPLREALDWLRDAVAPLYEREAKQLLRDPWAARDAYIQIILDRSPENVAAFFAQHARRELTPEEQTRVLKLLELQRHTMLMYTSCGWFFDELSGIETVQVIHYAGRVIQLGRDLFKEQLEPGFLERLERARSNVPEHQNGRVIYEKWTRAAMVDLSRVAAHYAMSSLFESYDEESRIYSYSVERVDCGLLEVGPARLSLGRLKITSDITRDSAEFRFAVTYFGSHNLFGGVKLYQEEPESTFAADITAAFQRADIADVIRLLDAEFGEHTYSLRLLFRDEQRRIQQIIVESTMQDAHQVNRQLYERHAPLIHFMTGLGTPLPKMLQTAAEAAITGSLREQFEAEEPNLDRVTALLEEARLVGVQHDQAGVGYAISRLLEDLLEQLRDDPAELPVLARLEALARIVRALPFEIQLWKAQNMFYLMAQQTYPDFVRQAAAGDEEAGLWAQHFRNLGDCLGVYVPPEPEQLPDEPIVQELAARV